MKLIEVALMFAEQKHALKQKLIEETGNKNIKDYDVDILVEQINERECCKDDVYTLIRKLNIFLTKAIYIDRERRTEDFYLDSAIKGCSGYFKLK